MTIDSEKKLYELQRDLANRLGEGEDIDSASIISLQTAIKACQMDSGAIFLIDEIKKELYLQISIGFSSEFNRETIRYNNTSDRWAIVNTGKPIYANYDQIPIQHNAALISEGVRSIAWFPFKQKQKVIGGIFLASHQQSEMQDQQKSVLETIAAQIGLNIIRIRAQEQLISSESKYLSMINASQDLIFTCSDSGKIIFSNVAFRTTLGYREKEVENLSLSDLIVLEDALDFEQFLSSIFLEDKSERLITLKAKNGLLYILLAKLSIGIWDFKKVLFCQAIFTADSRNQALLNDLEERNYWIDLIPLPAIIVDPVDYFVLHGNEEFKNQFGYTDFENKKLSILQLFAEKDYVGLIDGFKKNGLFSLKDGTHWSQIRKDGTLINTRININPIRWLKKDSILVVMNLEENQEWNTHSIQEDRYREVVNKTVDLIVRFTIEGMITFVNQAYCDFFNKSPEQLIGRPVNEQIHEYDMELFAHHVSQISAQLPIRQSQNRMIDGLGRLRTVRWLDRGIFKGDQMTEIQGVGHDISEEVSQMILEETMEQRFQILVEGLQGVVYVLHAETMFAIYISPQIGKFSGFSQQEVYEDPHYWASRIHPEDIAYVSSALERRIKGNSEEIIEYRFIHKDGHIIWAQDRGSVFLSPGGAHLLQGVIIDISASQIAKQKLEFYATFERMVNDFSLALMTIKPYQWDEMVKHILKEIGSQLGVDRTYLFKVNHQDQTISNSHEWCAEGIEPVIDMMQNIPLNSYPWWFGKLIAEGKIAIEDLDEIPETEVETREIIEMQSIQSVLIVSMQRDNHFCGFIGFDKVVSKKKWEPEVILLLRMISDMMMNAKIRIDPTHFDSDQNEPIQL